MSWPLDAPVRGPAFALVVRGIENFETAREMPPGAAVFTEQEVVAVPVANTLYLEGHYLPGIWRRFVRVEPDGTPAIAVLHPAKAVLKLKVLFASPSCARDGFIGLELYTGRAPEAYATSPSFALTGPTGGLRPNLEGQMTADSIQCMYPRGDLQVQRILDYMVPEVQ